MTRQKLKLVAALVVLAVPVAMAVMLTAGLAAADTQPPPLPAVSTSPLATSLNGQSSANAGSPTGAGGSVTVQPCTAPCSSTITTNQDPEPVGVGVQSGHVATAAGDSSQLASAGAPYGSANVTYGQGAGSFLGPSGGSYNATGCLSIVSKIPTSLPLSGVGNSCPNAATATGASNGGSTAAGGSQSGSGGSGPGAAGSSGSGSAGGQGAANGICAAPAAARTTVVNQVSPAPNVPLTLALVLAALAGGYLLSALRARSRA